MSRLVLAIQLVGIAASLMLVVGPVRIRLRRPGPDVSGLVFGDDARRVLDAARHRAAALGHPAVGFEHLLLALLADGDGGAARVLASLGVDRGALGAELASRIGRGREVVGRVEDVPYSAGVARVLEAALVEAHSAGAERAGSEHLLAALATKGRGGARRAMARAGLSFGGVREAVRSGAGPRQLP